MNKAGNQKMYTRKPEIGKQIGYTREEYEEYLRENERIRNGIKREMSTLEKERKKQAMERIIDYTPYYDKNGIFVGRRVLRNDGKEYDEMIEPLHLNGIRSWDRTIPVEIIKGPWGTKDNASVGCTINNLSTGEILDVSYYALLQAESNRICHVVNANFTPKRFEIYAWPKHPAYRQGINQNVPFRVVNKYYNGNEIIGYLAVNLTNGQSLEIEKDKFKAMVSNGTIYAVNMTLTSDGRLIEKTNRLRHPGIHK